MKIKGSEVQGSPVERDHLLVGSQKRSEKSNTTNKFPRQTRSEMKAVQVTSNGLSTMLFTGIDSAQLSGEVGS